MQWYKCVVCDHLFENKDDGRPVCPNCHSLIVEQVERKSDLDSISVVLDKFPTINSKSQGIETEISSEFTQLVSEIEKYLNQTFDFGEEDIKHLADNILKEWRNNADNLFQNVGNYKNKSNALKTNQEDVFSKLEIIINETPIEWDDYLQDKLRRTPRYFKKLEKTRRRIFEEWLEYIDEYEKKRDNDWGRLVEDLKKIDAEYLQSANYTMQEIQQVKHKIRLDLNNEQTTEGESEKKRHEEWINKHIALASKRRNIETNRRDAWEKRFSDPKLLWNILKDEWQLSQQRQQASIVSRRTQLTDNVAEYSDRFKKKKQFYEEKIRFWVEKINKFETNPKHDESQEGLHVN